jgi:hypothetical protein
MRDLIMGVVPQNLPRVSKSKKKKAELKKAQPKEAVK